ncbi:MAG: WD40/YVTN/BNR-like repeat-containing protein [Candidatus Baltobacteraceae bacterium]
MMGGRLDVVAGVPGDPKTFYLGHASGGLWKSTDGGLSFTSMLDTAQSSAIGAIALDPHNPRHIFAATGESFPRNTADAGDGLWASSDAGKHWRHLGFKHAGLITRIAISPANGNVLLVAVLGKEFAPDAGRGLYRSADGGAHFTRVLAVNNTTGASDAAFDPKHASIAYAGTFDFLRRPWTMRSGGPGSGLFKSTDSGVTWKRLTDARLNNGLPSGNINRVGVSICPSDPRVIYAFVPVRGGMLYRSTDGGKRWELRNASQDINFRPFYFSQVRCHPANPQRVYAIGGALLVSDDGGRKFRYAGGGGDNHDLWIDPRDPDRMLNGSDMGLHFTVNGGKTWSYDDVVPFAQVYRVGYDMAVPYHVMGGLQDHEVWWGPSTVFSLRDAAGDGDWLNIADWGDGQFAMADPRDASIVYEDTHFGDLARLDLKTGERRYISPQPLLGFGTGAKTYPYRFNWSAPLLLSHFHPDTLYFGGNALFRSSDAGATWSVFSPDLTHCGARQLDASGGPISLDDTNAETYCTIYSIGEDALDARTVWYGTDNGHLELTRDGGAHWNDLARAAGFTLPARISSVSPSARRPGVAYVAVDRHQWDDDGAYAYATADFGKTWRAIGPGLNGYVHVVREDPRNASVLYAGTERGIFVSFDAGSRWTPLQLGLPHVPVYDLQIHPRDNDLLLGTHGRGFYVLDDLTPLQELKDQRAAQLFAPMPAYRYTGLPYHERGRGEFVAQNKPYGALVTLYLPAAPAAAPKKKPSVAVRVLNATGESIDAFDAQVHAGMNRFTWDLHEAAPGGPRAVQDAREAYIFVPMSIEGPQVLPGSYTIEVRTGTDPGAPVLRAPVSVLMDPRSSASSTQLHALYDAASHVARLQERAEVLLSRLSAQKSSAAMVLAAQLRNPEPSGYRQPAQLTEQLAYVRYTMEQYDGAPTAAQLALVDAYAARLGALERQAAPLFHHS